MMLSSSNVVETRIIIANNRLTSDFVLDVMHDAAISPSLPGSTA